MRAKFLTLAPILLAVVLGVALVLAETRPQFVIFGLLVIWGVLWLVRKFLRWLLARMPRTTVVLWQVQTLWPIALIAATTWLTTAISLSFVGWLTDLPAGWFDPARIAAVSETVKGVVTGAIGAFIAGLWLDDAEDPDSGLWPSGQLKSAVSDVFLEMGNRVKQHPEDPIQRQVFEAINYDRVGGGGPRGWSVFALFARAALIAGQMKRDKTTGVA